MAEATCKVCGGPVDEGFMVTTNGSGLLWSHEKETSRLRPHGLEVIVPTGFGGTYSANLPGVRCPHCQTITLWLAK